jgi:hypothetical protein
MLSLSRFFRRRRIYRTVLQELSGYLDHDCDFEQANDGNVSGVAAAWSREPKAAPKRYSHAPN